MPVTLLVIDDEPLIVAAIADALSDLCVQVVGAGNGAQGLAQLAAEPPTLVLLDLSMPVLGGLETLREIRASAVGRELPVVVMTASAETAVTPPAGASGVLRKPFGYEQLLSAVRPFLDRGQ